MKKITLFLFAGAFTAFSASAQVTVQSEDFTTYLGNAVSAPAGWTFSYHGNYTSTASSGTSGPNSYKFGQSVGAPPSKVTSPMFTLADSLSFWIKGNSTDTISTFVVMQSADNVIWDTIAKIIPIPTTTAGQTYGYAIAPTSHYIGFAYFKSLGNVAFDDYRLLLSGPASVSTNENAVSFSLSPNPGNGVFLINVANTSKALLTVYNITGAKILEKNISAGSQSFDLSSQANGSYFVTLKTEKETITKKLIINK